MKGNVAARILLDYSSIENDFKKSKVIKSGKQDIIQTLQNYIDLLKKSANTLELLKDSLEDDDAGNIELGISVLDNLEIKGDPEIIERFVGFGIADYDSDNDFMTESSESDETYDSSDNTSDSSSDESDSSSDD